MWQAGQIDGRDVLWLGRQWLVLDEIQSFQAHFIAERDNEGLMVNFSLFGILACAFVIPVLHDVIAAKFLIGAGLLGAIALMSLSEIIFSEPIKTVRLEFTMRDGRKMSYSSGQQADVAALVQLLEHRFQPQRGMSRAQSPSVV